MLYDEKFCQSCAMPMGITDEHYGTESDGKKNGDYCHYCYMNGEFKRDVGMNEMLEICVKFIADDTVSEKQAREKLKKVFPTLKRWVK